MFPIIPQHIASAASTRCLGESAAHLFAQHSVRFFGRTGKTDPDLLSVTASSDLPNLAASAPFTIDDKSLAATTTNLKSHLALRDGKIVAEGNIQTITKILPNIRIADDCHSFNIRLTFEQILVQSSPQINRKQLILETVKPIIAGEEILLWFSEDILAVLQMAFLTPENIQGQNRYVCHKCTKLFEYPNPLKIHLTLDCAKSTQQLWKRLRKNLQTPSESSASHYPLNLSKTSLNLTFNTHPETSNNHPTPRPDILRGFLHESHPPKESTQRRKSCEEGPTISPSPFHLVRPLSEPSRLYSSAFQPYSVKTARHFAHNNNSIALPPSALPFPPHNELLLPTARLDFNYSHASQMETLVSNLGKSKQGHLCIYCGKIYSRKYGLKIHIRTHTGFKPLKCKYCLRPFGDPSNLNKHVRLHAEGETPYKCEICDKVLVRRRDLERHLKSRHMLNIHPDQLVSRTEQLSVHEEETIDINS